MYAWLSIDAATQELGAHWIRVPTEKPPTLSPDELTRRSNLVATLIRAAWPGLESAERARLQKLVAPMTRYFPDDADTLDFAIHMALAHHRLPTAEREGREQKAEALIHGYFGELSAPPQALTESLAMLRATAVLVPDPMLLSYVQSECGQRWRQLLAASMHTDVPSPESIGIERLTRAAQLADREHLDENLPYLYGAYSICLPARRNVFTALVTSMVVMGKGTLIQSVIQAVNALPQPVDSVCRMNGLIEILHKVLVEAQLPEAEAMPASDLIAAHIEQMKQRQARAATQVVGLTIAALHAGVPMGVRGQQSHVALGVLVTRLQAVEARVNATRLRTTRRATIPAPGADAPTDADHTPADIDPVHAWSVNRLVRWIEGPLVRRPGTRGKPIDRNTIARNERQEREQRNRAPVVPGMRRVVEETFTAQDVGLMVEDALAATARFFLDELDELLPLADALQAPAALIDTCRTQRAALVAQLAHSPGDELARERLGLAEAAIAALRQGIRTAEVSQRKQERFDSSLALALQAESLALGKRHGGVIHCPMAADDWPWVAQTYHHRWLPRARSLLIDGQPVSLPPDQALALYVTGSSRSAYAFDISVHLWRRRPGCDSAPGQGESLYPPMNEDDWFDTHLPCCVLHVPAP